MKNGMRYISMLLMLLAVSVTVQGQVEDEEKISELDSLASLMEANIGTMNAVKYAESVYEKAKKNGNQVMQDYAVQVKLSSYHAMSQYDRTIEYADSLLQGEYTSTEVYGTYCFIMYIKAVAYIEQGKYKTAIQIANDLYDESVGIVDPNPMVTKEAFKGRCNSLICIGLANSEMGMYDEAIAKYTECIEMINKSPNKKDDFLMMILEAETYRMQTAQKLTDKTKALGYIDHCAKEIETFKQVSVGTVFEGTFVEDYVLLLHIAYTDVYCDLQDVQKAAEHLEAAEQILDAYEFVEQYYAELDEVRAKYFNMIGDSESALICSENAINYYKEVEKPGSEVKALKYKLNALNIARRYEELYGVASRIISLSDTLSSQRLKSSLEEMQTMMDVDKLENETRELETQRQMLILISMSVLMAAFAGFVLMKRRRDKEKQRILSEQKKLLEEEVKRQTHELREQRDEIEQKNRDITDSINYAQRIQNSILPDMSLYSHQGINGAFAFFIPCHIVSGDFYWAYRRDNKLFFACADCTGHGVPGAFMSMIGTTILNDLCKRPNPPSPCEMLELLHINLLAVLQQSGDEDSRDGMDIAIMQYDIDSKRVAVSGARRPVYLYMQGERVEYKAAKRSIGERDYTRETLPFTQEEYQLTEGDTVYMCSDGLPDQFGGPTPKGKRLMGGGLKRMLDKIVTLPIEEQQVEIEKLYWEWRNDKEQLDDISLVGVRV